MTIKLNEISPGTILTRESFIPMRIGELTMSSEFGWQVDPFYSRPAIEFGDIAFIASMIERGEGSSICLFVTTTDVGWCYVVKPNWGVLKDGE